MMIPSTEGVRNVYASVQALGIRSGPPGAIEYNHGGAKFDRWLAEYTAEVERAAAARALEEAVNIVSAEERSFVTSEWGTVVRKLTIMDALRARAAEYRKAVES